MSKSAGLPSFLGSSDNEYWVFAIHIGRLPYPKSSNFSISFKTFLSYVTDLAP